MTGTLFPNLIDLLLSAFAGAGETSETPDGGEADRDALRGLLTEVDPTACGSEMGAYTMMSMFPREF